jgi:glutamate-1-semialdehyde 2,1-aminomutase
MYGHQNARHLPPEYPQFFAKGEGSHIWDVDGNEYIDFMCSYGPIILGHRHPGVEAAVVQQQRQGDCQNGPSPVIIDLAEQLVATVRHADWAMFAKNGTDATTICLMIARAGTGRRKVLVARGAYHGSAPWCTPRPDGTVAEDRAHLVHYTYNDLSSLQEAADRCEGDLAAVVVSPFRHDAGFDQELPDPTFLRGMRELCDRTEAALILDEVRCGFRLNLGGSWETLGVEPDLSAWSKAIANGYPLSAVLGRDRWREAAGSIFVTGSFWFSAAPMVASLATIAALREEDAVTRMFKAGTRLRDGIEDQAKAAGLEIRYTGPPQMPYLTFAGDQNHAMGAVFASTALQHGIYVHPRHNWFMSAALSDQDIDVALSAAAVAFSAVKESFRANQ